MEREKALRIISGEHAHDKLSDADRLAISCFVQRVKDRAEKNMEHTGVVSGAHWNAMRQVLAEMGIDADI